MAISAKEFIEKNSVLTKEEIKIVQELESKIDSKIIYGFNKELTKEICIDIDSLSLSHLSRKQLLPRVLKVIIKNYETVGWSVKYSYLNEPEKRFTPYNDRSGDSDYSPMEEITEARYINSLHFTCV